MPDIKTHKRLLCALLTALLILGLPVQSQADSGVWIDQPLLENLMLSVDGGEGKLIKTLHYGYGNNRYVSLRDFAAALSGTPKHFSLSVADDQIEVNTGADYTPAGGENQPFPETNANTGAAYIHRTHPLTVNAMRIDGRVVRYLSFLGPNTASKPDCFMSLTDLAMQLDLDLEVSAAGMKLDTDKGYTIDLEALEQEGFYYEVHSALIGDATTGEIYAAWEPELTVPIASTTKLMSFLVLMDAVSDGQISLSDKVTIPGEAARLSHTVDGMIWMEAGAESNVTDLLCGMMLASSNESALALAVHTAGSEEAFVRRMNSKARALGLSEEAVFYNSHGLPVYTDNLPATKIQNRMSAHDMFLLVAWLLRACPEITQITSLKSARLESFDITVSNTNPLLYNLEGVVGLKTGTTNMSGSCLVTALKTEDALGQPHTLVAVEFGAEDNTIRATLSEELLRYGLQRLREKPGASSPAAEEIPADAEGLIRAVLRSF